MDLQEVESGPLVNGFVGIVLYKIRVRGVVIDSYVNPMACVVFSPATRRPHTPEMLRNIIKTTRTLIVRAKGRIIQERRNAVTLGQKRRGKSHGEPRKENSGEVNLVRVPKPKEIK